MSNFQNLLFMNRPNGHICAMLVLWVENLDQSMIYQSPSCWWVRALMNMVEISISTAILGKYVLL